MVGPSLDPTRPLPDDERALSVVGMTVNEKSPYLVFTVTGQVGQYVQLALVDGTASRDTDGTALDDGSEDFGSGLQYHDGTVWQPYVPGSYIRLPNGGTTLLVRTPVIDDLDYEVSEDFTLEARTTGGQVATGTGVIRDDGQGAVLNAQGVDDPNAVRDDDRPRNPASVNDLVVNEASPYAVFTVSGVPTAVLNLALVGHSATAGVDFNNALQVYVGGSWSDYNGSNAVLSTDGTLLVRTTINNQADLEGPESFSLEVQYTGLWDSVAYSALLPDTRSVFSGDASISDDGLGTIYPDALPLNGDPQQATAYDPATTPVIPAVPAQTIPDDDRVVTVNAITVNEKSPYAVFTVGGFEGQYVKLVLGAGSTNPATAGSDYTNALEYWNGSAWVAYTSGSYVQVPGDGDATGGEAANLLVRVAITDDNTPDSGETFTLTVFNTGGGSDEATCTLVDNGYGSYFPNLSPVAPSNPVSPLRPQEIVLTPEPPGMPVDPNRPLPEDGRALTVSDITVNEKSPYAVFTVGAFEGQYVQLVLGSEGTNPATAGSDYSNTLEYWNGSVWVTYTSGSYVQVPTDGDPAGSEAANLLVRVAITDDNTPDSGETFKLTAFNTAGDGGMGICTLADDGSGRFFPNLSPNTPSNPSEKLTPPELSPVSDPVVGPTIDPLRALPDDERALKISSVEVSEASPWLIWSVHGHPGQYVKLDVDWGTATPGVDAGPDLEYWNGSAWINYAIGTHVKIPYSDGLSAGTLLVRVPVHNDSLYEGTENLSLSAASTGGAVATGRATIRDDGKGEIFASDNNNGVADDLSALRLQVLDDDRLSSGSASAWTVSVVAGPKSAFELPSSVPALHVQNAVASGRQYSSEAMTQGCSGSATTTNAGVSMRTSFELHRLDLLLGSFSPVTDPSLHVQLAVAWSRQQSQESQLPALGLQTGLLREIPEMQWLNPLPQKPEPIEERVFVSEKALMDMRLKVASQPSDDQAEDDGLAPSKNMNQWSFLNESRLPEGVFGHQKEQKGRLNFSRQLQMSARAPNRPSVL